MRILVIAALLLLGCGASVTPAATDGGCADGYFLYTDRSCSAPSNPDAGSTGSSCREIGDGECHKKCGSDVECGSLKCVTLGLYAGGDFSCNERVKVCAYQPVSSCPP